MKYTPLRIGLGFVIFFNAELVGNESLPFYIEGALGQEIVRDGAVVSHKEFDFSVWVDSPFWMIRMFDTDPDNERSYGAYGSDGKNVYWYLWDQTSKSENPESRHVPGRVNEGHLPLSAHQRPFLVWFAFCSSRYFESVDESHLVPAPWATPRYAYYSAATDASMSFLSSGLPRRGEFRLTHETKREAIRRGWVQSHTMQRAERQLAEFPDEFRLGTYQVLESERDGDFEIPRKVLAEVFWPEDSGSPEGWLESRYTITVSDIQLGELDGVGGPLEIPDGNSVSMIDTRLTDPRLGIDQTDYTISDGVWPAEPPEEAVAAFERNRERLSAEQKLERKSGSARTVGIIVLIGCLGFLPVLLVLWKR